MAFPPLHDERAEAARLGISHRTLQAWRTRGGGPPFYKLGSAVRYSPAAVDQWLAEQARTSTAEQPPAGDLAYPLARARPLTAPWPAAGPDKPGRS